MSKRILGAELSQWVRAGAYRDVRYNGHIIGEVADLDQGRAISAHRCVAYTVYGGEHGSRRLNTFMSQTEAVRAILSVHFAEMEIQDNGGIA